MAEQLPNAIQKFIDATNNADSEGFVAAFTTNGSINDWGNEYDGADRIARWNQTDNIGKQSHFELVDFKDQGANKWLVNLKVTGNGFNGTSPFTFELEGDQIKSMVISPD